jgi:hypothetical protein
MLNNKYLAQVREIATHVKIADSLQIIPETFNPVGRKTFSTKMSARMNHPEAFPPKYAFVKEVVARPAVMIDKCAGKKILHNGYCAYICSYQSL